MASSSHKALPHSSTESNKQANQKDIQGDIDQLKVDIDVFFATTPPDLEVGEKADHLSQKTLKWLNKKAGSEEKKQYRSAVLVLRGKVLNMLGKYDQVITLLKDEAENESEHWELLALAYLKTRKYAKVEECCNAIFKKQPANFAAMVLQADAILLQGSYLYNRQKFEKCRSEIEKYLTKLADGTLDITLHTRNAYWFEMISVFVWNKNKVSTENLLIQLLKKLEEHKKPDINIALLYGFIAHLNYVSRDFDKAAQCFNYCERYLAGLSIDLPDETQDKLLKSTCEYIQLDIFLAQYRRIFFANYFFFSGKYHEAKDYAYECEIGSEYFQDWMNCLQVHYLFMLNVKPCLEYFSLCDSQGYAQLNTPIAKQKAEEMVSYLEKFTRNKYRFFPEINLLLFKGLSLIKLATGGTILHVAARLNNSKLLELFFNENNIAANIDINMQDAEGKTLLDHAILMQTDRPSAGAAHVMKVLRRYDAKTSQQLKPQLTTLPGVAEEKTIADAGALVASGIKSQENTSSPAITTSTLPGSRLQLGAVPNEGASIGVGAEASLASSVTTQEHIDLPATTGTMLPSSPSQVNTNENKHDGAGAEASVTYSMTSQESARPLTTTAAILSAFTSPANTAVFDEKSSSPEKSTIDYQDKVTNLSRVVQEAAKTIYDLDCQLAKADRKEKSLGLEIGYLKQELSALKKESTTEIGTLSSQLSRTSQAEIILHQRIDALLQQGLMLAQVAKSKIDMLKVDLQKANATTNTFKENVTHLEFKIAMLHDEATTSITNLENQLQRRDMQNNGLLNQVHQLEQQVSALSLENSSLRNTPQNNQMFIVQPVAVLPLPIFLIPTASPPRPL